MRELIGQLLRAPTRDAPRFVTDLLERRPDFGLSFSVSVTANPPMNPRIGVKAVEYFPEAGRGLAAGERPFEVNLRRVVLEKLRDRPRPAHPANAHGFGGLS